MKRSETINLKGVKPAELVHGVHGSGELSDAALDQVAGGFAAYMAWFTCLKSCADSKGQVQGELARFR